MKKESGRKKMQKASAGGVCSQFVRLVGLVLMLACCLLSIPDSRSVILEHSSRHDPRYFLFLLFFGLGGQFASG